MVVKNSALKIQMALLAEEGNFYVCGDRWLPSDEVLDTLVGLQTQLATQLGGNPDPTILRKGIRTMVANPQFGQILLAWSRDDRILGQCEIKKIFEPWDNAAYWYIDNYVVSPECRGMGVGTQMLQCVKEMARIEQIKRVRLYVAHDNPKAREFYVRNGFESHGEMMEYGLE